MTEARKRKQCMVSALSALISFFVGAQCVFILSANGIALPSPSSLDLLPSSVVEEHSSSSLYDEAFFSSLFERGEEFRIVPIQIQPKARGRKDSICVVVRTFALHGRRLGVFLSAWENIAASIGTDSGRDVQIILANTDASRSAGAFFYNELSPVLADASSSGSRISYHLAVLPRDACERRREWCRKKRMYGYDVTQLVLDELLNGTSADDRYGCTTLLISNGDNYYNPDLLVKTKMDVPQDKERPGLVGFDFVSHHRDNQRTLIKFMKGHVDLGSVFVNAEAVRSCAGARFFDRGDAKLNFILDWYFFEALMDCGVKTERIRQTLFMHH